MAYVVSLKVPVQYVAARYQEWLGRQASLNDATEANGDANSEKEGLKISGACTPRIIDNKIYETGELSLVSERSEPNDHGNEYTMAKSVDQPV